MQTECNPLLFNRLACGYGYYAISFGVEQLSGSLYLNMFLLSIVEIPALLLTWYMNNWYVYVNGNIMYTLTSILFLKERTSKKH